MWSKLILLKKKLRASKTSSLFKGYNSDDFTLVQLRFAETIKYIIQLCRSTESLAQPRTYLLGT